MYETLSSDYDRFMDWRSRLAIEIPFIIEKLHERQSACILDAATGTGMHAIALAQRGYKVAGADLSQGMVDQARQNAQAAGVQVRFEAVGFGHLTEVFGSSAFDAVLCLGNSLPHVLSHADLDETHLDFATCLKPGGLLLIQNRNFDKVVANHERWMEPQSHVEGETEWLFQRFYDFNPDGLLTFNMMILKRVAGGNWTQKVVASRMRPLIKVELLLSLTQSGFINISPFGDMTGTSFDPDNSPNLVISARKHG